MQKYIITTALTYANGPLHLGHMVEYIQADIWHRCQQMKGREGYFIAGSDAHGTPIMLSAEKNGISPEQQIQMIQAQHQQDLHDFGISVDSFLSTHDDSNQALVNQVYNKIEADIDTKTITQAYDCEKAMFLPDRFIKGECPRCHSHDQYGDNCECCGATYSPNDLINPVSALSGTAPDEKDSLHYFFRLDRYQDFLDQWLTPEHIPEQMCKKIKEWFSDGLQAWDISRDAPYFGFLIPGTKDKYFYVWLDAPLGYMSFFQQMCDDKGLDFNEFWKKDSDTVLYHFIGKDIFYFHALFWPAVLQSAGYRLPSEIFVHGFLSINGDKMSKSRGTFISARNYLDHIQPDYFRYYLACKLSNHIEDLDFNFEEFIQRSNSDLVGKFVNIASRCANFIHRLSNGMLSDQLDDPELFQRLVDAQASIMQHYDDRQYHHAMREIMALADLANQYIDQQKPWSLAKQDGQTDRVQAICSQGINMFRLLCLYLKPVIPSVIEQAEAFLNIPAMQWQDGSTPLLKHKINVFKPLLSRLKVEDLQSLNQNSPVASS